MYTHFKKFSYNELRVILSFYKQELKVNCSNSDEESYIDSVIDDITNELKIRDNKEVKLIC